MNFGVALLFLVFALFFGNLDVKKRGLRGFSKFKVLGIYLYFGLSMSLFVVFTTIMPLISIFIFLHLVLIICAYNLKENLFTGSLVMMVCIAGMIWCVSSFFDIEIKVLWFVVLGGCYLLPAFSYFERKRKLRRKREYCTERVEATVIKATRRLEGRRTIYVPKFEFYLKGKRYVFMDTNIYFDYRPNEGEIVELFVNPNCTSFSGPNGCDDVLCLSLDGEERRFKWQVIFWYLAPVGFIVVAYVLNFFMKMIG